jgi:hypothetical protein
MSNLIEYLIPLFGKTQNVNGKEIEDERLKLFLWMQSNDPNRIRKYAVHGDGSTWLKTTAKTRAFRSLQPNNTDPEICVLVEDFANRVQSLDKNIVINNLNKLAGKDLDATANFIIHCLFDFRFKDPRTYCQYH